MSKKYRDYVRSFPCAVTRDIANDCMGVDPHHIKGYAWVTGACGGKKGHDLTCIPLRHDLHNELHNIGWESFESKYDFSQAAALVHMLLQAVRDGMVDTE